MKIKWICGFRFSFACFCFDDRSRIRSSQEKFPAVFPSGCSPTSAASVPPLFVNFECFLYFLVLENGRYPLVYVLLCSLPLYFVLVSEK